MADEIDGTSAPILDQAAVGQDNIGHVTKTFEPAGLAVTGKFRRADGVVFRQKPQEARPAGVLFESMQIQQRRALAAFPYSLLALAALVHCAGSSINRSARIFWQTWGVQ